MRHLLLCAAGILLVGACAQDDTGTDDAATCSGQDFVGDFITLPVAEGGKALRISKTEITNAQFTTFVAETGYVTDAEKLDDPNKGGGAVFVVPSAPGQPWWAYARDANWRHPDGADSSIDGKDHDPVVQISYRDAVAYAQWAGGRLPTEQEWAYAAAAGSTSKYVWGDSKTIDGKEQANTWQGMFPVENTEDDGYLRRAPVGCFDANDFGLYDMIGNVWEWTASPYRQDGLHQNIIKGGSFLCADNYCQRYTVPAREKHEIDFSTNHIGFRIVKDL